jgi:hypothetical protein
MLTGSNVCPPPATIHPIQVGIVREKSEWSCHWLTVFRQPVLFNFRSTKNGKPLVRRVLRTSGTILNFRLNVRTRVSVRLAHPIRGHQKMF